MLADRIEKGDGDFVMCSGCWVEYGSPTALPPGAESAIKLIGDIYAHEEGVVGGPLHVHLDDWNLEGEWSSYRGHPFPADLLAMSDALCVLMNQWSVVERAAVLAVASNWFEKGEDGDETLEWRDA